MQLFTGMPHYKRPNRFRIAMDISRRKLGFIETKKLTYLINVLKSNGKFYHECLLDFSLKYLTACQKRRIIRDSFAHLRKIKMKADDMESLKSHCKIEGLDEALKPLYRNEFIKRRIFREVLLLLQAQRRKSAAAKDEPLLRKLKEIGAIFSLNNVEQEVLLLFYLINLDSAVDKLHDAVNEQMDIKTYQGITVRNKWPIALMTGCSKNDIDRALSKSSAIIRSCLVTDDETPNVPSEIIGFLEGAEKNPISTRYFHPFNGQTVPITCQTVGNRHIEMVRTIFRNRSRDQGIHILLYGEPGTGKTEFARSLGKSLGLSIFEINNLDAESDKEKGLNFFRYRALMACQRIVPEGTSLIIMDEADTLLNAEPLFFSLGPVAEKGQINKILDESKAFVIWITNRYDGIDDSTKRRFDYSVGFEKMTFSQRRAVWRHGLVKYKLAGCVSAEQIDSLAAEYEVNAGGIDVALRNASRICGRSREKNGIMEAIRTLMKAHLKILDQERGSGDIKKADAPQYSLEGLNIKGDVAGTLAVIDKFNKCWQTMEEQSPVRNMNILLYGPPGTGKTEFAKFVARRTCRRLIVKRASDILNMYVGESEKNIRKAFEEAERDKAILFIDEADSFFWNRESASRSWEVTQVNELLTNMETFRGMLISSTNFKKIVDSAAIRRFNIKLEFDCLKPEGSKIFYNLFLGKLVPAPLSEKDSAVLGSLAGLTPGDFKVVYQKYSFFDKKELSHGLLIEALRQELGAKDAHYGKTMGFGQT